LSSYLPPFVGGAEKIAQLGTAALRDRGHSVTVVGAPLSEEEAPVARIPSSGRPSLVNIPGLHRYADDMHGAEQVGSELQKLLSEHVYDVLYAYLLTYPWSPFRSRAIIGAAREHGVPVVAAELLDDTCARPELFAELISEVDAIVCPSLYIRDRLRTLVGPEALPTPSFELLYPRVVSQAVFCPDHRGGARSRRALGLGMGDFVVFFPSRIFDRDGTFSARKQALVALDAFADFARVTPGAVLLAISPFRFLGADQERHAMRVLRSTVMSLGIEDKTVFVDIAFQQRQMASYYRAANIVLVPSVEAFGLVYLEAMSCGVPVVGVAAGAAPEVIGDAAGILVAPGEGTAERLTRAMVHLSEAPGLRTGAGVEAATRARALFGDSQYGGDLEALLKRWARC
jgi:glycosyltransferase involved in cell wall biosynthesis